MNKHNNVMHKDLQHNFFSFTCHKSYIKLITRLTFTRVNVLDNWSINTSDLFVCRILKYFIQTISKAGQTHFKMYLVLLQVFCVLKNGAVDWTCFWFDMLSVLVVFTRFNES